MGDSKKVAYDEPVKKVEKAEMLTINPPNFKTAIFTIMGTAPYVQQAFSEKARNEIKAKQEKGSTANKGKTKEAKDFNQCYLNSMHISRDGWHGIPAGAFRAAMISACRTVGFKMTLAKLSVFVEADGFDKGDGTPLIKITKGEPHYVEHMVRIQQTVDVRARAMWDEGWEAQLRISFDADQFTLQDLSNLLMRVGIQVGIGEGRPDSKSSAGMGWGTFLIKG
jgi:hypothetical protein